jgi:16S rRNA (uracil1498-N3)-methyltransferase
MDEIVEKGTEVGVVSFIFYYSEKAYARMIEEQSTPSSSSGSSTAHRIIRLERVARAAAKQCRRTIIPSIEPLMTFNAVLRLRGDYDRAFVAAIHSKARSFGEQMGSIDNTKKILLLVGPESGLTDEETSAGIDAGFAPVSLGPRRLRTETAGIVFPAMAFSFLGDL